MTSKIQGQTVRLTKRDPAHSKNVSDQGVLFAASPSLHDLGPKATSYSVDFVVDGPSLMDDTVRAIADKLLYSGFAVITDGASIYYSDPAAFVKVSKMGVARQQRQTRCTLGTTYIGNNLTHRLVIVATSRQLPNYWERPGLTTFRIPPGCVLERESLTDAGRNIIRTPAAFATQDATYSAGRAYRNGGAGVACHAATPDLIYSEWPESSDGVRIRYGIGADLSETFIQNVLLKAAFSAAADTMVLTDLLGVAGASARTITMPAFGRATHGVVGMPVTPQRAVVGLDTGAQITLQGNGNLHFRPFGAAFKVPGGVTRALGSGVFWHDIGGAAFMVGTTDFAVASDGTVTYGPATLGAEILANGGFETYTTTPGAPDSWTSRGNGSQVLAKDATTYHGGVQSFKNTVGAGTGNGIKQTLSGLTVGTPCRVRAFGKTNGADATVFCALSIFNVTDNATVVQANGTAGITQWELLEVAFTPVAGKTYEVRLAPSPVVAGTVVWWDDASAKTITGQSATNDPAAVFGFAFTAATGTVKTARLQEMFADLQVDWYLEPR